MKIKDRFKQAIRDFYVLYADSTELLEKAEKLLRPLPDGCELVKLTYDNKDCYKCQWNVNQILEGVRRGGQVLAIVNDNNEIIAYHYGVCRDNKSMFFKVKNCDFEHIELLVNEEYRRKGIAIFLLYHMVKSICPQNENKKTGTCIRPDNIPSIKLHELIGFKISHRVKFFHMARIFKGHYAYFNFPHYKI